MAKKLSRRVIAQYFGQQLIAGSDQATLSHQLAGYLVESKRTKEASLIVSDIESYLATQGIVMADVTAAFPLSDTTEQAIRQMITGATGSRDIHLKTTIDASVLGGIKLSIPGKELDSTVVRKLSTLRTEYKKA